MARSTRIAIALASVLTVTAAGASAQEGTSQPADPAIAGARSPYDLTYKDDPSTYEVTFTDDPLTALGSDVIIPMIRVRGGQRYPMLHRARTQFVREMLKSVDAI
jgi:hypothetical protein